MSQDAWNRKCVHTVNSLVMTGNNSLRKQIHVCWEGIDNVCFNSDVFYVCSLRFKEQNRETAV